MTATAIGSVKGAPGVTTTLLAMASVWPASRPLLVVECDPDGGVLAARRELAFEPGLVTLAAGVLRGATTVVDHTQRLSDTARVITAPAAAEQVHLSLDAAEHGLWSTLVDGGSDLLIDCGRLAASSPAMHLAARADHVLLLARPTVEDVALLRDRLPSLRRAGVHARVLLLDDGVYRTDEVAEAIGVTVLARLPIDNRTADALNGVTTRSLVGRSRLLRAVRQVVDVVVGTDPVINGTSGPSAVAS